MTGLFAGRYTIERVIGQGATATVHLARDMDKGMAVAIKMLRPELAQSAASERFLREIRQTIGLSHPRILPVLDSGEYEGQLYFVLPYMEGGTLRDRLNREKQLPIDDVLAIVRPVADALDYAHKRGLIHRDVKPENILFTSGEACLGDFGIARALEHAYGDLSSSTGVVRGTAAYMSPEQASASPDLDGRSDIYSLGCVVYEMLAGVPAFIAATPEAVIAQRFSFPPREIRVYRASVTPKLELAIGRALLITPADRYRTAGEFAEALTAAHRDSGETPAPVRPDGGYRAVVRRHVSAFLIGAVLATAVVATVIVALLRPRPPAFALLDTTRIAVLPLERVGSAPVNAPWQDDDLLHQALARWRGISVVDQFQVADALRRQGPVNTSDDAAKVATALGAGRYIRGRIAPFGKGWRVSATLFDVARRDALHESTASISLDVDAAMRAYAGLADSLLFRGAAADAAPAVSSGSRSLPAVQSFGRGERALDNWDLPLADSAFQSAVAFDPDYPRANLWLAQVRLLRGLSASTWITSVERAMRTPDRLNRSEQLLLHGLVGIGRGDFAGACASYEQLRRFNDRDFSAWYGLGECRRRDRIVVRAPGSSPSGWAYRSSRYRAVLAYQRALELLPSAHRGFEENAYSRLRGLLYASPNVLNEGLAAPPDTQRFLARQEWMGDTLALVPYPIGNVVGATTGGSNTEIAEAVRRQREVLREVVRNWSSALPRSASVKEAVAVSLELLGDPAALDTLIAARALSTSEPQRLRLRSAEVLLRVQMGVESDTIQLARARLLADSLLTLTTSTASSDQARVLSPVAAASGRCTQAGDLSRLAGGGISALVNVPPDLINRAQALTVRAAMGCEGVEPALIAVVGDFRHAVRPADLAMAEYSYVARAASLVWPISTRLLDALGNTDDYLLRAQSAMLHKGRAASLEILDRTARDRQTSGVESVTVDEALPEAQLLLQIGDSARATRLIDESLAAVRQYEPDMISDPAMVGALVRLMLLNADLSRSTHSAAAAQHWSGAVRALWANADPSLRSRIGR